MSRPLFDIAREIAADWASPSHQARTYLKGMYYLLGMDDRVADLDAMTTVRMFLLYSKGWTGPVAERVKAELSAMRSTNLPTNAELLASNRFPVSDLNQMSCDSCDASLGSPAKFVDAFTHWKARKRMCQHCALCLSPGIDLGDGAVYMADASGAWRHLHGEPNAAPPGEKLMIPDNPAKAVFKPKLRHRLKLFGRKVAKKCVSVVRGLFRRSA